MNVMKVNNVLTVLFLVLGSIAATAQNVHVHVSEIKTNKGQVVVNVFKDEESYKQEKPFKRMKFDKQRISNGALDLNFALDAGVYGITLLDDENSNSKMDKNFVKMPKEGFGFSDFYLEKLERPKFDDFKVVVKEKDNNLKIRVKYL